MSFETNVYPPFVLKACPLMDKPFNYFRTTIFSAHFTIIILFHRLWLSGTFIWNSYSIKNYKYTKSLILNTLRYNQLLTKTKTKKILILDWLGFLFYCIEVRAFTVIGLKILAFSTSKNYFIYFTTSLYNTHNIKYSIFLSLHLK